jgi:D-tyrosyl-tRNA(Tyr) deacylase
MGQARSRRGRQDAVPPEQAEPLYVYFVEKLKAAGIKVSTGRFRAQMEVGIPNDGPVTLILESP